MTWSRLPSSNGRPQDTHRRWSAIMPVVLAAVLASGLVTDTLHAAQPRADEQAADLWLVAQLSDGKVANFNDRCGKTLDPLKDDDSSWTEPCRSILGSDLRKIILSDKLPTGAVRLVGVHITGGFDLSDSELKRPLTVHLSRFDGAIDLSQAKLLGAFEFNRIRVAGAFKAPGAHAEKRLSIVASMVGGELDVRNTKVDGSFILNDSVFESSIRATGLEVAHNLMMLRGLFKGIIDLTDANIGGSVDMERSVFDKTVNASRARLVGTWFMNNHTTLRSRFILNYVTIGGNLEMEGQSDFSRIEGESLQIGHHLFMGAQSTFREATYLPFLRVAGYIDLRQGIFTRIDLSESIIGQELRLSGDGRPAPDPHWLPTYQSSLVLTNAEVGTLEDSITAWPVRIDLEGFRYSRFRTNADRTVDEWKSWLAKSTYGTKRFNTQPYSHLAKVLTDSGLRDQGLALQFTAREGERRQAARDGNWLHWAGLSALRWLSGYGIGMYTFIAVPWVIGSVAVGVLALWSSRAARVKGLLWCVGACSERLLPIIELNKEFSEFFFDPKRQRLRDWQLVFFALYALWGWVLGLLLVAAMSGLTQGS